MGWMCSNIALRDGRYVAECLVGTLVDVRTDDKRAGPAAGVLIASVADAGEGIEAGLLVVGAVGVGLHTTGTP